MTNSGVVLYAPIVGGPLALFDHLVRNRYKLARNFEPKRPRSLALDDELEPRRLIDRQVDAADPAI